MHPAMNPNLHDAALIEGVIIKTGAVIGVLEQVCETHAPVAFANSLGAEDMVLTDIILKLGLPIGMFTLDTGRLPVETHELMARIDARYGTRIRVYHPDQEAVANYVRHYGRDGFYDAVEARKACCQVRKLEPLRRALADKKAWVTGLRAAQSVTRTELAVRHWDADNGLEKVNPLAEWSEREVWVYLRTHEVPYNALHDHFYPSIGCAPCTRAVALGEDVRAGRWWWENPENKECGLHRKPPADPAPTLVAGAEDQEPRHRTPA
jgi:phosphoadenosine phosphosulfate reductase